MRAHSSFELNLTGDWTFAISAGVRGQVGLELANATNEQEIIDINRMTGEPVPGVSGYQLPRELRIKVDLSF